MKHTWNKHESLGTHYRTQIAVNIGPVKCYAVAVRQDEGEAIRLAHTRIEERIEAALRRLTPEEEMKWRDVLELPKRNDVDQ